MIGIDATPYVTLERVEDLIDDGLEPLPTVGCGAHLWVYVQIARDSVSPAVLSSHGGWERNRGGAL